MTLINPSIDQGALSTFENVFYEMAQQKQSKLESTGVFRWFSPDGKTHNLGRLGKIELQEVQGRNPEKQYGDYAIDNRMFTKSRFTKTIPIDAKDDINELITNPEGQLLSGLVYAKNRVIDRIGINASIGNVLTGATGKTPVIITPQDDGVLTIDATSGMSYTTVEKIVENYINNEVPDIEYEASLLAIAGKENTALMNDEKFINNRYIDARPVQKGVVDKAGSFRTIRFAGSATGGITVPNPVLPEGPVNRTCVALCPDSVALMMKVDRLDVERSSKFVNSWEMTIDLWIGAMRMEGARVQKITTLI